MCAGEGSERMRWNQLLCQGAETSGRRDAAPGVLQAVAWEERLLSSVCVCGGRKVLTSPSVSWGCSTDPWPRGACGP